MKKKEINIGFKRAVNKLGVGGVADVLGITTDGVYRILRGDRKLKLEHAAKLYDNTKISWKMFREWE